MFKKAFPWSRRETESSDQHDAQLYLVGDKVILRDKKLEDVANDYAWRRDPELSRLDATTPIKMGFEEYYRYAEDEVGYTSRWSRKFGIDTLDGDHIGNCMFYDIDLRRGQAELGIMIGNRAFLGKGYGTDSVATMLEHIFTSTSLNRVYLHTLEWNQRARQAFERAGFHDVRQVRRGGMNFILMEVVKADWEDWREREHRDVTGGRRRSPA